MAGFAQSDRWGENWLVVSPPGSVRVRIGRRRRDRRAAAADVQRLAPGTGVVLQAPAPFARSRTRRVVVAAGIEIEREYIALPNAEAPAYLVEDRPAAFDVFVDAMPTPPGSGIRAGVRAAMLSVVRSLRPRRLVAALGSGRVVVGRR
jgi:hypothetical protein